MDTRGHLNAAALDALVTATGRPRSRIAAAAGVTPGHLHDLCHGRRLGTDPALRRELADAIGCAEDAITCWCATPSRHRTAGKGAA